MATDPASRQLKLRTDALHRRLDSCTKMRILMSPALDINLYAEILSYNAVAWSVCERPLLSFRSQAGQVPAWFDSALLAMSGLIEQDQETLGDPHQPVEKANTEALDIDPSDPAQIAGLCYVLSGSGLGSRVILKRLQRHQDARIGHATAHLRLSAENSRRWPSIVAALDNALADVSSRNAAIRAARSTFELWLRIMQSDCTALEQGACAVTEPANLVTENRVRNARADNKFLG